MSYSSIISSPLVIAAIAIVLYIGKELLAETGTRTSHRLADWLLPDGLPSTYRVGKMLLIAAHKISPAVSVRAPDGHLAERRIHLSQGIHYFAFPVMRRSALDWSDLWGAQAELEVDEAAHTPIASPIRLVLPLVMRAIQARVLNGFARLEYGSWWLAVGVPYVFLQHLAHGCINVLFVIRRKAQSLADSQKSS